MLDLVEGGSTLEEVIQLAKAIEAAGATIINTGIGWHEARIPTIATKVPRAAYAWVTQKLKGHVNIPLVATNRINTPEVAEQLLADNFCDMVSMARPLLADPLFMRKAEQGKADEINTCIGCNQACLDHTFGGKITSCLVNPRACHETELVNAKLDKAKRIAVVGAGPAGLSLQRRPPAAGMTSPYLMLLPRSAGNSILRNKYLVKKSFMKPALFCEADHADRRQTPSEYAGDG
jgi:2,4-dienoyl-CoA reductase (NADPH2)